MPRYLLSVFKKLKRFSHQLKSTKMVQFCYLGLYLGILLQPRVRQKRGPLAPDKWFWSVDIILKK